MKTCEEMLKELDEMLAQGDHESRMLWDVLTALRGPDAGGEKEFTGRIRSAAFPKTKLNNKLPAYFSFESSPKGPVQGGSHWGSHTWWALHHLIQIGRLNNDYSPTSSSKSGDDKGASAPSSGPVLSGGESQQGEPGL